MQQKQYNTIFQVYTFKKNIPEDSDLQLTQVRKPIYQDYLARTDDSGDIWGEQEVNQFK